MAESLQKIHVAVAAFPFGSHPRPLKNLLLKLANSAPNILFTFFNTQKSNDSMLLSSNLDLPINVKIYNVEDGVPLGHHFTGNPVEPLDLFLKVAHENLTKSIQMVVAETGINITCLITDAFLTFGGEIAEKFDASWIPIWISLPCGLSAHIYTEIILKRCGNLENKVQNLDFIPGLSMMRVKDLPLEILDDSKDSIFSKTLAQIGEALPNKASCFGVSSYEELNPKLLNNDLKSKFKHFLNLGFLGLSMSDSDTAGCVSWLDKQPPKSVVYIGFGTVAALPEKELKALAEALETCKNPFLWSLRDDFKQNLPNGFLERTSEQGKIVAWAPQSLVLAHNSVAVFISQAGGNSVYESIVYGVPTICRPVLADNKMIGKMVEDVWGIGIVVENGVITVKGMIKNLEMFLPVEDELGKKMKDNVQELKKVVLTAAQPIGSAARDFSKLVEIISVV